MSYITSVPFGWPVLAYFILGGFAGGVATIACWLTFRDRLGSARQAFGVALGGAALGGLFLILDLENPLSFWLILSRFNPASIIAWGARLLVFFILACGVSWWAMGSSTRSRWARALALVSAALGVALAYYPGWVLLQATARPFWQSSWIAPLLLVSALHMGLGFLWLAPRRKPSPDGGKLLPPPGLEMGVLGAEAALLAVWLLSLWGQAPHLVSRVLSGELAAWMWLGVVGLAVAVPAVGLAVGRGRPWAPFALGLAPILGGVALRAVLLFGGQGAVAFL